MPCLISLCCRCSVAAATAKWNKEVKENKLSLKEVLSRLAAAAAQISLVGWVWGPLSTTNFKAKFRVAQQCWERLTE